MPIKVHDLQPAPGAKKSKIRVGRGTAGRRGKTAGRGTKGQGARDTIAMNFEGGQMPLHMRVPKQKGFNNPFRVEYQAINLDVLEGLTDATVDPGVLHGHGLTHKGALVKILGRGAITRAVTVRAHAVSKAAEAAITGAGGTVEILPLPWGDRRPPAKGNHLANRWIGKGAVLSSLRNVFRIPDLRNKILFTLAVLAIYRLGSHIPVPGIDISALGTLERQAEQGGVLAFFQLFSGGALTNFAVFALGIMPYITSSIIIQILTVVIPKLEQWQAQGAVGQRKLTQTTRYLTIAIAIVQSTGLAFVFHNGGAGFGAVQNPTNLDLFGGDQNFTVPRVGLVVLTLTVGTALLMWLGELITQRGIGNGMSLLIFASVVSTLPGQGSALRAEEGNAVFAVLLLFALVLLVLIVIIENGQRRIPVQFAKRVVGRRMYGGQSTYIPLKVNQAGIIPIIFASSVLYLPLIITNVLPTGGWGDSVRRFVDKNFGGVDGSYSWLYVITLGLLVIGFAYFYTAIAFDPARQADQIRKQGGFIPGIRPGPQTERYLAKVLNRITLPGAVFIALIAVLPVVMLTAFDVRNFPFAGTSILIAVGVALETMKQIDSQLMMRNYEGFLK